MRLATSSLLCFFLVFGTSIADSPKQPGEAHARVDSPIVAQLGGAISNVAASGEHAYVGVGTRILALDVSDRAHPVPASWSDPLPSPVHHLAVDGNRLYVASAYVTVLDISEPTQPEILGMIEAGACRVVPNGDYLYELGACGGFPTERVVDVRDPRHPTFVGELPYSQPHVDLVVDCEIGFATYNFFLQVLDVSNPAAPLKVGEIDTMPLTLGRLVYDHPLLYGATNQGLATYDVGGFPIPVERAAFYAGAPGLALALTDQTAFLVTDSGLSILDVSQTTRITQRSQVAVPGAREVTTLGGYAYVTGAGGVTVVDVSDPDAPEVTAKVPLLDTAREVAVAGNTAFVAAGDSGLAVVDLTDPTDPRAIGVLDVGYTAQEIALEPGRAYVAGTVYGPRRDAPRVNLSVVDIVEVASLTLRGHISLPGKALDLAVADGIVYVAAGASGVSAIDVSDASSPQLAATAESEDGSASELLLNRGVLAVVENTSSQFDEPATNRLRLFDATALPELEEKGRLTFDSQAESRGMALVGQRLYLPGSQRPIVRMFSGEVAEDLLTINLADPTDPRPVGFLTLGFFGKDIAVVGDTAYIAAGRDAFRFDPQTGESLIVLPAFAESGGPRARWTVDLPAVPRSVAIAGDHAVLALHEAGLYVVDVRPEVLGRPTIPPPPTSTPPPTRTVPPGTVSSTPPPTPTPLPTSTAEDAAWLCWMPYAAR